MADIGCGAGTQARLWAERGHRVHGVDVNEPLDRAGAQAGQGSGLGHPLRSRQRDRAALGRRSMDVCLLPELLEHVADWQSCLNEAARILRPGGLLYLSTTNVLCPKQQEFNLPLYSWYPARLKRYCERLAVTTRPEIANYAKYPAVHWFSFYGLRDFLEPLGFPRCLDRFDLIDVTGKSPGAQTVGRFARAVPLLRFLGHVATPSTYLVAVKHPSDGLPTRP